jgi:hypothetical protein
MRTARIVTCLAGFLALTAQTAPPRYAVGQIWEYKTRPGDEGSLLKIQAIEDDPAFAKLGPVYHISVIGFHFHNPRMTPVLPHSPVSRETLDASVTRMTTNKATFPDVEAGIEEWHKARGGVFTIGVAQIVEIIDAQTEHFGEQPATQ